MTMLAPGSVVGIFGGGQLGRMLSVAAAKLGFDVHIFTDEIDSPASRVSAKTTVSSYLDTDALTSFAASADVLTTEFENIPVSALEHCAALGKPVRPGGRAVAIAQDRLHEKTFLQELGIATAPFLPIYTVDDLRGAMEQIGTPALLKTRRFGYDGKGQVRLSSVDDAAAAWRSVAEQPCVLEGFVSFEREVSVILARTTDGATAPFDLCENHHADGILRMTRVPSAVSPDTRDAAVSHAQRIALALDYVGVLTIEFFVTQGGAVVVNEIAPRVHNSGHWTVEACATSQFEQHIRAIAGWPFGSTARRTSVEMANLIGDEADTWRTVVGDQDAHLTLYGKRDSRPGRKMGHVTRLLRPEEQ